MSEVKIWDTVRPPIIRTNAILKNKNLNACLTLWEYIESVEKVGYSFSADEFREMPSDEYISDLYSSVALQYLQFYTGVTGEDADNRLLSQKHLSETYPDFEAEVDLEDLDDYSVYDSQYKKLVPVSRLMNNRKKLSQDERKIRTAIEVALRADEILFNTFMEEEAKRRAEEEARRRAEEEARRREEEGWLDVQEKPDFNYRYRYSYLARLILSDDELKNYYNVIKNTFFAYKKVKSRISKRCETFRFAKNAC